MKYCPRCQTAYSDETLIYCLSDGTALVAAHDEQATFVRQSAEPFRVQIPQAPTAQYVPVMQAPPPAQSSSGLVKVLLAIIALGVLLFLGIGAAGAFLYFSSSGRDVAANTAPTGPSATPSVAPSLLPSETPTPSPAFTPTPAPTIDKAAVADELISVEKAIINAALKGDTATLSNSTTDDFTSIDVYGKVHSKKSVLAESKNATESRSWTWKMGKVDVVSADENTVVIRYTLTLLPPYSEPDVARLTETYVKQNGRWLLKTQKASSK